MYSYYHLFSMIIITFFQGQFEVQLKLEFSGFCSLKMILAGSIMLNQPLWNNRAAILAAFPRNFISSAASFNSP